MGGVVFFVKALFTPWGLDVGGWYWVFVKTRLYCAGGCSVFLCGFLSLRFDSKPVYK